MRAPSREQHATAPHPQRRSRSDRRAGTLSTPTQLTEQRPLIAERPEIAQAVAAIPQHHGEVTDHAALIVPGPPPLEVRQLARQRPRQPAAISGLGQQRAASVRDLSRSVRYDIYREITSIALSPSR